jgi:hypothetical protein
VSEPKGVRLLVGGDRHDPEVANADLPRNSQGRALVGDKRNDENLITAQLHLLFLRFHNKVVELVLADPDVKRDDVFDEARRRVRWHYQWIVVHDFLGRILGDEPPAIDRLLFADHEQPYMPVEFSGAAFRFGHSMVRPDYTLREGFSVPIFRADGEDLRGFRPLPTDLVIDWENFFRVGAKPPQASKRIDLSLTAALAAVPPDGLPLAWLNLRRGRALGLPAGRDVAHAMQDVPVLSEDQLMHRVDGALDARSRAALGRETPLWYYVLREAELLGGGGLSLGPVGGRIVGEVLVGLLEADPSSYVQHWPEWKPTLGRDGDFTMPDLIELVGS